MLVATSHAAEILAFPAYISYLVSDGYLAGNPLALRRERTTSARRSRRVEHYLDHAL